MSFDEFKQWQTLECSPHHTTQRIGIEPPQSSIHVHPIIVQQRNKSSTPVSSSSLISLASSTPLPIIATMKQSEQPSKAQSERRTISASQDEVDNNDTNKGIKQRLQSKKDRNHDTIYFHGKEICMRDVADFERLAYHVTQTIHDRIDRLAMLLEKTVSIS